MPPDPPNSLMCSVFLALAAVGPRQCERLEPPVILSESRAVCQLAWKELLGDISVVRGTSNRTGALKRTITVFMQVVTDLNKA